MVTSERITPVQQGPKIKDVAAKTNEIELELAKFLMHWFAILSGGSIFAPPFENGPFV